MRRVERLMMGSPMLLRSVNGLTVVGRKDHKVLRDWMSRFAPTIRYSNPTVAFEFRVVKAAAAASEAASSADVASGEASGVDASADRDEVASTISEADSSTTNVDVADSDAARIELLFADESTHVLNLALYRYSHQVMQRIVDLDLEKGISTA
eukprot:TRINITY_DN31572_c0_g1_i1.p1 TRINITY_DN31572_c0_g1~~TRINITY_DN31572_c0_g1_i1.p1  ORF type:complete len:171 (-),score=35.63 TRINITY_DN31572_c0_g1_i1:50-508(-)